jgi:hypothetical protein
MEPEYNETKKREAQKKGDIISHDRTPETGEGLHGETLSPLPNVSEDFPTKPTDLTGVTEFNSEKTMAYMESQLPLTVSHAKIAAQANERMNVGHPKR